MLQRLFLILTICFSLSACSYFKKQTVIGDQAQNYKTAVATPELQIPADLNHSKIGSGTEQLPANITAKALPSMPMPSGSLAQQIADGQQPKSILNQKLPEVK